MLFDCGVLGWIVDCFGDWLVCGLVWLLLAGCCCLFYGLLCLVFWVVVCVWLICLS